MHQPGIPQAFAAWISASPVCAAASTTEEQQRQLGSRSGGAVHPDPLPAVVQKGRQTGGKGDEDGRPSQPGRDEQQPAKELPQNIVIQFSRRQCAALVMDQQRIDKPAALIELAFIDGAELVLGAVDGRGVESCGENQSRNMHFEERVMIRARGFEQGVDGAEMVG